MTKMTTIQLEKPLLAKLKKVKDYPRQTYNELISNMIKTYLERKKTYDPFLHRIQQPKMKELWDNPSDEDWERA